MPRRLVSLVTAVAAAGAAVLLTGGGPAVADSPSPVTPPPTTCTGVIRINSFVFDPAQVFAGKPSTGTLTATNCTGQSQAVTETWSGRYLSSTTTGFPAGCAAIDPLPRGVTFAPHARVATSTTYATFPSCTADIMRITVNITQAGTLLGTATADLTILHTPTP